MPERQRLSRHDWAAAALEALGAGGLAAVAVEPIAARLGATKGSFYWHFRSRDALVEAALELWERRNTEDVIVRASAAPSPREALRTLMTTVLSAATESSTDPDAVRANSVEVALQAEHGHPLVRPALERVSRRRTDYLRSLFVALGFGPAEAEQRALTALVIHLGHVQLARATPALVPHGPALAAHVDGALAMLLAPGSVTSGSVTSGSWPP